MREIGPEPAAGRRPGDGVTVHAGGLLEDPAPPGHRGLLPGRTRLLLHPALEILGSVGVDAEEHLGVLGAAVLGALAEVEARLPGLDPHLVPPVGDEVRLSRQARDPEAVVGVGGPQLEEGRGGVGRIADRHVQLVGGHHLEPRVTVLPPELVADRRDHHCPGRARRVLQLEDDPRGGEEEHHHDQHRDDGPGQLDLPAAVDLRRLAGRIAGPAAEPHHRVGQQGEDHQEDGRRDEEDEQRQLVNRLCGSGGRGEEVRRAQGHAGSGGPDRDDPLAGANNHPALPAVRVRPRGSTSRWRCGANLRLNARSA
jgi:hypothetical protein